MRTRCPQHSPPPSEGGGFPLASAPAPPGASVPGVPLGRPLPRAFFDRPCLEVAPDLLGTRLVRRLPGGRRLVGRVVEVEAYLGEGRDPASHAHRGPTQRNRSMFGPPGRLYAYRSYGIHVCINVVCEARGSGAAVLVRAVEPLEGIEQMRRHRGLEPTDSDLRVARGPGRIGQAFAFELDWDGATLLRGPITLHGADPSNHPAVARGPRIGIRRSTDRDYRFYVPGSPWVCRSSGSRQRAVREPATRG